MTLDGVTSFSRIKNVRNTSKRCITVKIVGGISLCNGGKLEVSEGSNCFFHRFFFLCVCVRIEIDQLYSVYC